jgi:PAS domain S-box-containing protein
MENQTTLITQFTHELTTLRQRLASLKTAEATTRIATATLQDTLEKLHTAEEELRQQRDELTVTQQAVQVIQQRSAALFAQAPDAYLVTDAASIIEEANQATATLFGITPARLIGTSLLRYVVPDEHHAVRTQLAHLAMRGRVQNWALQLQSPTKSPFPASITIAQQRLTPESPASLLWLIRDMTAQQHLEDTLRHAERQALLGTLATDMTHAMRTPLATLFLCMDLFEDVCQQAPAALQEPITECLTDTRTALTHLQELLEDYGSLAHLDRLQYTEVDVGALLTTVAQDVQPLCTTQRITLWLEGSAQLGILALHQQTFRRALLTLVHNAIEAMPAGGMLTLRASRTAAQLTIAVCDTGHGMPRAQVPVHITPLRTTSHVTGLGLAVVREIIAAHGGTMTVQSAAERGTMFTITLPVSTDTPPHPELR